MFDKDACAQESIGMHRSNIFDGTIEAMQPARFHVVEGIVKDNVRVGPAKAKRVDRYASQTRLRPWSIHNRYLMINDAGIQSWRLKIPGLHDLIRFWDALSSLLIPVEACQLYMN